MKEQIYQQLQTATDPAQVRQQLRQLEKTYPELTLARQLEEIQEMALQVVLQGQSPTALKRILKKFPAQADGLATVLNRFSSLLNRLDRRKETCLNAAGQVQTVAASPQAPLLIDTLEQISAAARQIWPDSPSPGEAVSWFWPAPSQPNDAPALEPLQTHLERLSQLDQQIADTNRQVKLIDRINIFTDSPEEARLKQLKAERKAAENLWKEALRDYHDQAAAWRCQQEACFLSDRLVSLIAALAQVSTKRGRWSSRLDCPLNNTETLLPDCNWLLEKQTRRHGFTGDYDSLVEQICQAQPGQASLPQQLKAHLGNSLNGAVKAAQLAASEHREAGHFSANAAKKVTLMDKINIFSDSPREKAAQEAKQIEQELAAAAQRAEQNIRTVLLEGLQSFPAANLYYMCEQLRTFCGGLHAVCRSENVSRGYGDDRREETEYWCEIIGLDEARRQAALCASTFHQYQGQIHGLYGQLTRLRMARVQQPSLADLCRHSVS